MKHTSFLYRDFWLWFPLWIILFIIAFFIESQLLETLAVGLLLTCLAAMAAFSNMDKNEIKKKNREDIENYIDLLEIISSRYFSIKNICELCNEVSNDDSKFTRGLRVPELNITPMHSHVRYSKYSFLVKAMLAKGKEGKHINNCLDLNTYIDMEARYHNLIAMMDRRNEINRDIMDKVAKISPYSGSELFHPNFEELSQCINFYQFSGFLYQTECVIIEMNHLLSGYKNITKGLQDELHSMFTDDATIEFGGMCKIPLHEDKLLFDYVELSVEEQEKLKRETYP
ncbi:hypothetical protein [Vibrio ezurae]|uniref:Uncharacterized protein n=1 Tax=Vibrio ezurae NBRC 102218 TaxID=1219080 RepID=U3AYK2_9VIBR|nr:hypothetical protein [Vibrio ezurae]GAD78297.1 hypothetical protein VEZ01S_01_00760 [Vibrio ezurae NBRC 102218]